MCNCESGHKAAFGDVSFVPFTISSVNFNLSQWCNAGTGNVTVVVIFVSVVGDVEAFVGAGFVFISVFNEVVSLIVVRPALVGIIVVGVSEAVVLLFIADGFVGCTNVVECVVGCANVVNVVFVGANVIGGVVVVVGANVVEGVVGCANVVVGVVVCCGVVIVVVELVHVFTQGM